MRLSTTTEDLYGYADTMAGKLALFEGTGFRTLDFSFYYINIPGSPFLAPGDLWKREIEAVAETAARMGVTFNLAHSPPGRYLGTQEQRDNLLLSTKRSMEACAMLGIKDTVVHSQSLEGFTPMEFMKTNLEFHNNFFDTMEKTRVNLLIENGSYKDGYTHYLYNGAMMREYIEYAKHPMIFACWDTGHAHMNTSDGDYQYQSLVTLGDLLHGVHIADNAGLRDDHTGPYFGTCNFSPVIQALLDIDYKGTFNFESTRIVHSHNRTPWTYKGAVDTRLDRIPLHIKKETVALCYKIGKHMLEQYACFED